MPAPLAAAAAAPLLGSLGAKLGSAIGFAKGLTGLGGIAKSASGIGGFAKGAALKRLAGQKLAGLSKGVNMADDAGIIDRVKRGVTPAGFAKNLGIPMSKSDIAMTVAPDLLFGGITAATTEGDIGDKLIAGVGSSVGGIAGGLGGRGLLGPKSGLGILGTEMVGGMIGDQVGYGLAENLIHLKGGGMTPAEKKQKEADALYKQQLMAELGLM